MLYWVLPKVSTGDTSTVQYTGYSTDVLDGQLNTGSTFAEMSSLDYKKRVFHCILEGQGTGSAKAKIGGNTKSVGATGGGGGLPLLDFILYLDS